MNEAPLSDEIAHITPHFSNNDTNNTVPSTSHDHNYDHTPVSSSTNDPCPLCGSRLVNKVIEVIEK